ncbi:YtpI family protein [Paenibacillus sp. sgz500958]|uniref:YtpI family protein n=1 Tax=Paenibacillus sp. sgz500958 TaxID=3242475 RepID=UPI0036D22C79
MIITIKYLLFILLVIFVISAALFSIAARRTPDPLDKGLKRSALNILMGAMLVTLALMSMFLFHGSTLSVIIEAVFILMGLFNMFSGLRSRSYYLRMKSGSTGR